MNCPLCNLEMTLTADGEYRCNCGFWIAPDDGDRSHMMWCSICEYVYHVNDWFLKSAPKGRLLCYECGVPLQEVIVKDNEDE